jgi:hypothetical protein
MRVAVSETKWLGKLENIKDNHVPSVVATNSWPQEPF